MFNPVYVIGLKLNEFGAMIRADKLPSALFITEAEIFGLSQFIGIRSKAYT